MHSNASFLTWLDCNPQCEVDRIDAVMSAKSQRRVARSPQADLCINVRHVAIFVISQKNSDQPLTLVLPGLGDHYVNMGRGLYETEPIFREQMDKSAELLQPELGLDIRMLIYPANTPAPSADSAAKPGIDLRKMLGRDRKNVSEAEERLGETRVAQPALFIVEYALARLWQALGIQIDSMIGYSLGEYTPACLAQVLSLEDSLKLVARRAALIEELPPGAMLAVPMAESAVTEHLGAYLSISAINGPEMAVVAGPPEEIEALEKRLGAAGTVCRRVQSRHAFHSKMMEPLAARMTALLADFKLAPPAIPYISNVTGTYITPEQATDPSYFATHLCRPVRFADGIAKLMKSPTRIFLESGPGQTLSSLAISHPSAGPAKSRTIVPSMRHPFDSQADTAVFQKARETLNALSEAAPAKNAQDHADAQPTTATETELMAIWQKLLSVPSVEKTDSFLALGGNSLVASRMLFRIFKSFRINLPLRRVYEAPTLAETARAIDAMRAGRENTAAPAAKAQDPTFIRYRLPNGMDIFHQNEGETRHFYEDIFDHRSYAKHGIRIPEGATVFDVLMSCRVMSRGVGTVLLNYILRRAKAANVRLLAEFVSTDRNRMMYVTYKFAGFKEISRENGRALLENDFSLIQGFPPYMKVEIDDAKDNGA